MHWPSYIAGVATTIAAVALLVVWAVVRGFITGGEAHKARQRLGKAIVKELSA